MRMDEYTNKQSHSHSGLTASLTRWSSQVQMAYTLRDTLKCIDCVPNLEACENRGGKTPILHVFNNSYCISALCSYHTQHMFTHW